MKSILFVLSILVMLTGCASAPGQALLNPVSDADEWQAEQAYVLEKLERFCFDRSWEDPPLRFGENRAMKGGQYRLYGGISDDIPSDFNKDFHYTCYVRARVPMQATFSDPQPVRASAWWSTQRRKAFLALLEDRFQGYLASERTPRNGAPWGAVMLLRDGETVLNLDYFPGDSGVQMRVYRRRIDISRVGDDLEEQFGFGAKPTYISKPDGVDFPMNTQFIKQDARTDPLPLHSVININQLPDEKLQALEAQRRDLDQREKLRLQFQARANLDRLHQEAETRTVWYKQERASEREMAAFERRRKEQRRAAVDSFFTDLAVATYSQAATTNTPSTSTSASIGSSTPSANTFSNDLTSSNALMPWSDIQAEANRARAMKARQHQAAAASRPAAGTSNTAVASPGPTSRASSDSADARTSTAARSSGSSSSSSDDKRYAGKVYEPNPITITGKNGTWFSKRDRALNYARLKAANDINEQCRERGARSDAPGYREIREGVTPPRWNYGSPDCKQGGWRDEEWLCEAPVSGTCYRRQ